MLYLGTHKRAAASTRHARRKMTRALQGEGAVDRLVVLLLGGQLRKGTTLNDEASRRLKCKLFPF